MSLELPKLFADAACIEAGKPREPNGYVGASSMVPREDTCFKKHQFARLKTPVHEKKLELPLAVALLRGRVMHAVLTELSGKLPVSTENNVSMVADALGLSGSADFLFHPTTEPSSVVELKSLAPEKYRYLTKPVVKHVYQVHVYMMLSGCRKAYLYYVPHAVEPQDDLVHLLKRAQKTAQGLGGSTGPMVLRRITEILQDLGEWKLVKKPDPALGRQFEVPFDEKIEAEIISIMKDVNEGINRGEWLKKNLDNCELCPWALPCFRGDEFNVCDKRAA